MKYHFKNTHSLTYSLPYLLTPYKQIYKKVRGTSSNFFVSGSLFYQNILLLFFNYRSKQRISFAPP